MMPDRGHSGSDGTMAIAYPDEDLIICYFTQSRGGPTLGKMSSALRQALPQTRAIGGKSLYVPPLSAEVRQEREAKLAKEIDNLPPLPTCYLCKGPRSWSSLLCDTCQRRGAAEERTDAELDSAEGHGWGEGRGQ